MRMSVLFYCYQLLYGAKISFNSILEINILLQAHSTFDAPEDAMCVIVLLICAAFAQ